MESLRQPAAEGGHESDAALSPRAAEILRKMAQVAYVLDCHRQAVAKHAAHLTELQAELERLEVWS